MSHGGESDTEGMVWYTTPQLSDVVCLPDARRRWIARFFNWVAEARSHRVICLVLGIWLINGFDLALTILSHQQGMLHEENPVARHMLQFGTTSIVLYKVGLVLIGSYPLLRFRTARITELGACVSFIAYAILAIHWSSCYELFSLAATNDVGFADIEALGSTVPE